MRTLPVDAVLFDLDGTLADTAGDLAASAQSTATRPGPRAGARCRHCVLMRLPVRAG